MQLDMQQGTLSDAASQRRALRRIMVMVLGALGFLLTAFSVAWACTSQAHVSSLEPSSAAPGEKVSVSGEEYAADKRVEIRWESAEGPLLAATTTDAAGSFTVDATIPGNADGGEHLIFAIAPDLYPTAGKGAAMVHVQGDEQGSAQEPADEQADTTPPQQSQPAPDGPDQQQEPASETSERSDPAPAQQPQPAPEDTNQQEGPAQPADDERQKAVAQPTDESAKDTEPASDAEDPVAVAKTGSDATSGDVAGSAEPAPIAERAVTMQAVPVRAQPHDDAGTPPWRADSQALSAHGPATASQPLPADEAVAVEDDVWRSWDGVPDEQVVRGPGLGAGIGLLAVGLVALFAGFAAAEVTRRRQRVEVPVGRTDRRGGTDGK